MKKSQVVLVPSAYKAPLTTAQNENEPMRKRSLFNDDWLFAAEHLSLDAPDDQFEAITLPHTNKVFPHRNLDNLDYQFISTYRKRFDFSLDDEGQRVFLEFDGVMLACTIYLNGKLVGEHLGGYICFSVDITNGLQHGENVLTIYVDSRERKDIPPYGHLVDYLTFGGIYRDVYFKIVHPIHIENVFIQVSNVLDDPQLFCDVRLSRFALRLGLQAILFDPHGEELAVAYSPVDETTTRLSFESLPEVVLWSLDNPTLYGLHVSLTLNGRLLDATSSRFGFREAEFRPDGGFYLNGERVQLFGLNRHQTYPYIGAAAPARLQRQDADIIKHELACNIVRTSHYPQSPHFLDRCDEIGLLVFEEITGWQHVGDQKWQAICLDELKAMIERDRNHPCIVLWGVRVNESGDNDELYSRTNALAHRLDPTRQTGGVRCFLGSSFLEDVYTYNDFSNTVLDPIQQPYLITEFAGHMFPTKIWDHEQRLIDHALLHAKVHSLQMGNDRIAGAIGWSAFDYATHIEFGSGDRICYHGVMDIFRLPKWAAYLYQSQQSPSKRVVLQAATHWTMGDRSGGGVNPLTVFSNCDQVEVIVGQSSVGRFQPDHAAYPNLPHPPITIHGLDEYSAWGQAQFHDLHIVGYIQGEMVAEQWVSSSRLPHNLELSTDTDQLYADGADMTRLIFRITDEFGNPLPYATKVVTFELEGDADLIGENPFPLIGGQAALYVKARHQTGSVVVRAQASGLPGASVALEIVPAPS
jgi:beta-galactosidase